MGYTTLNERLEQEYIEYINDIDEGLSDYLNAKSTAFFDKMEAHRDSKLKRRDFSTGTRILKVRNNNEYEKIKKNINNSEYGDTVILENVKANIVNTGSAKFVKIINSNIKEIYCDSVYHISINECKIAPKIHALKCEYISYINTKYVINIDDSIRDINSIGLENVEDFTMFLSNEIFPYTKNLHINSNIPEMIDFASDYNNYNKKLQDIYRNIYLNGELVFSKEKFKEIQKLRRA